MGELNPYVQSNLEHWKSALIDTSKRNPLLFLNPSLKNRWIELGDTKAPLVQSLIRGKFLKNINSSKGEASEENKNIFTRIVRKAEENLEERGLQTLYLTLGVLRWQSAIPGREYFAPVLLLPLSWKSESGYGQDYSLEWTEDWELNRALQLIWKTEKQTELPEPDSYIQNIETHILTEKILSDYLQEIQNTVKKTEGVIWENLCFIGNFSYQKMAMVQDLEQAGESLFRHPVLQALCGDPEAIHHMQKHAKPAFDLHTIDAIPAADEFIFLPADSSQYAAIRNVLLGHNIVIQGPPGTGKSQTIANLAGELIARGKKVLFVAEKRAALEVVKSRMQHSGLGDFILDLHGFEISRKKFQQQLQAAMALQQSLPAGEAANHILWEDTRSKLAQHTLFFHTPVLPEQETAMELMVLLQSSPPKGMTRLRLPASLNTTTFIDKQSIWHEKIRELHTLSDLFSREEYTLWEKIQLQSQEEIHSILNALSFLEESIEKLEEIFNKYPDYSSKFKPENISGLNSFYPFLIEYFRVQKLFLKPLPLEALSNYLHQLSRFPKPGLLRWFSGIFNSTYRNAVKEAQEYVGKGLSHDAMWTILKNWKAMQISFIFPLPPPSCHSLGDSLKEWAESFVRIIKTLSDAGFIIPYEMSFSDLKSLAIQALDQQSIVYQVGRYQALENEFRDIGLKRFWQGVQAKKMRAEEAISWFQRLRAQALLSDWQQKHPGFATFQGKQQEHLQSEFRKLDAQKMNLAAQRIRRAYASHLVETLNHYPEQQFFIRRQLARKRIQSVKQSMLAAPECMMALFPFWMASPLSLTSMLSPDTSWFDVVIFDEASQIQAEDAICSILRGRQLVVAGDSQQLPPTPFFASGNFTEETQNELPASAGYESLLDMALTLPGQGQGQQGWYLRWHYRSRDESLIHFSNLHFYQEQMITFPGPIVHSAVQFIQVEPGKSADETPEEVIKVVDLIFDHFKLYPEQSLGVITLGIQQAILIETEFNRRLSDKGESPPEHPEPFFIKNLERVQGDERDKIIISIGFGQDRTQNLSMNFGPITHSRGERRWNVAITRSRSGIQVVCSFSPEEMDLNRTQSEGMKMLKNYLIYARNQSRPEYNQLKYVHTPGSLEDALYKTLNENGLQLSSRLGNYQNYIAMGIYHPEKKDTLIMGLETDGDMYQKFICVRDRDRLRPEHLKALGWNIHRVWHADWSHQQKQQIEGILDVYNTALNPVQDNIQEEEKIKESIPAQKKIPPIPSYSNIDQYSHIHLALLLNWIQSDGVLRTQEELMQTMAEHLGYKRMGIRIRRRLSLFLKGNKGLSK